MNQSILKLTVSTTETVYRLLVPRDILYQERLCLSVMLTDNTLRNRYFSDCSIHEIYMYPYCCCSYNDLYIYYSVTAPLDIVGVWTERGKRGQEPGLHLVQHLKTVTNQVRLPIFIGPTVSELENYQNGMFLDNLWKLVNVFQMNQSVLKLTVSTTERERRLLVQTDIR